MYNLRKFIQYYVNDFLSQHFIVQCIRTHVLDEIYKTFSQAERNWLFVLFPKNIVVDPHLYVSWHLDFLIEIILDADQVPNYHRADVIKLGYYKKEFPMPILSVEYKGKIKKYIWQDYVENKPHKWVIKHD